MYILTGLPPKNDTFHLSESNDGKKGSKREQSCNRISQPFSFSCRVSNEKEEKLC